MPDGRPQFSFTDFQIHHPQAPPPGDKLDSEIARLDRIAAEISSLAAKSLNSDGSLRSGTVGKAQLQPGLFDDIAAPEALAAKHAAEAAKAAAGEARSAAVDAEIAAGATVRVNAAAQDAASRSSSDAQGAANSAAAAVEAADQAEAFYVETGNAAKDTAGDVATCQAYADVTYAWAEHMPDPIPPNILAVMGITGDHWSSRWWANQAAQTVENMPPGPPGPVGPPGPAGPTGPQGAPGAGSVAGMAAGQLAVAATATAIGSSIAYGTSGGSTIVETTSAGTLAPAVMPAYTGDVTSPAGSTANVLATVNSNVGAFQGLTLDAKGRVTAAVNQSYLTTALASSTYLPLAGGTLTGALTVKTGTSPGLVVNANAASLPAPLAGTVAQIANVDGVITRLELDAFGAFAQLLLRSANGTGASPAPSSAAGPIGSVGTLGWDGAAYGFGGQIFVQPTQAWAAGAHGAYMAFQVVPNGSATLAEAMRIDQNGNVGIGMIAPAARLQVTAATGNQLGYFTSTGAFGASVIIDNAAGGNVSQLNLLDAGTNKWTINKQANNTFTIRDVANARNLLETTLATGHLCLQPTSGNVGIGVAAATGPAVKLHVAGDPAAGTVAAIVACGPSGVDTTTTMLRFVDYTNAVLSGAITRNGTNTVAYGTTSDERRKTEIHDSDRGLDALMALRVSDYRMGETAQQGLVAQQVAEHYPEAVIEGGDDPDREPWMLDYGRLTPLLIRTIQQQQAQIERLENRLAALEAGVG